MVVTHLCIQVVACQFPGIPITPLPSCKMNYSAKPTPTRIQLPTTTPLHTNSFFASSDFRDVLIYLSHSPHLWLMFKKQAPGLQTELKMLQMFNRVLTKPILLTQHLLPIENTKQKKFHLGCIFLRICICMIKNNCRAFLIKLRSDSFSMAAAVKVCFIISIY